MFRLIQYIEDSTVLDDKFATLVRSCAEAALINFVIDEKKARICGLQPGKTKITCNDIIIIVVLNQRLQQHLWRKRIGNPQSGKIDFEITICNRQLDVIVTPG